MPTALVTVTRVEPVDYPDRYAFKQPVRRFLIHGRRHDMQAVQLYTFNMWRAQRCLQAQQDQAVLRLGWRETQYGEELITVEEVA